MFFNNCNNCNKSCCVKCTVVRECDRQNDKYDCNCDKQPKCYEQCKCHEQPKCCECRKPQCPCKNLLQNIWGSMGCGRDDKNFGYGSDDGKNCGCGGGNYGND